MTAHSKKQIANSKYQKDLFLLFAVSCLLSAVASRPAQAASPVLFFSDLAWGPKSGWEGSAAKGAAVTVWGENFGSSRGSGFVTVNGAQLTAASDYAEWDAIGPARGLERITFWLNNNCADGNGTITVTVNGATSNALPFNITPAPIYFISLADGNNSNNGLYSTAQGGSNGPFKDLWKFNPCGPTDLMHTPGSCNPSQDGQYIAYVRAGTYTAQDVDNSMVALRGPYGGATKQKALIAYPGENPSVDTANAINGFIWSATYSPYGFDSYFTFSKLTAINGQGSIFIYGSYNRVIGCTFKDYLTYAQTGVVFVEDSDHTSLLGNFFNHDGNDSMKHNIYVKTQNDGGPLASTLYTYIGWNEFANPVASDGNGGVIFLSKDNPALTGYDTRFAYIHDNYFHDGTMDFIATADGVPTVGDIYVYNNLVSGGGGVSPYPGFLNVYAPTSGVYAYNNTVYQTGTGPMVSISQGNSQAYFKNNIWHAKTGQQIVHIEPVATATSDHDLFFNAPPPASPVVVTNPLTKDPLFVNAAANNFHLLSNSPAIDAGTNSVNTIVTQDYDGIARPQGPAYDIGAYELVGSGGPTVPTITSLTATPASITAGQSSTLSWAVTNATSLSIDNGVGSVTGLTSKAVSPVSTTTYTLTATNTSGSVTRLVTVFVTALPPPGQVATPTINPPGGTFTGSVQVTLQTVTPNAFIYYTTDGTDPTIASPLYSSPFTLNATTTLKAKAFASGMTPSAVASAVFTITSGGGGLVPPDLSGLNGKTFSLADDISFSYPLSGVSFRWTFESLSYLSSSSAATGGGSIMSRGSMDPRQSHSGMTAGSGAPFATTSVPHLTPASAGLGPGKYLMTVTVTQGNQSQSASATITLVVADFSQVKVYPNPWRSDRHATKNVTFANLPLGSTVKLFTVSGHQVRALDAPNGNATWDLKNDSDDPVASGVYVYLITAGDTGYGGNAQKVRGKLAVIK